MAVIRHADYGRQRTDTRRIRFRAANTQNMVTAIHVRMYSTLSASFILNYIIEYP
jgi:hypothetical protein